MWNQSWVPGQAVQWSPFSLDTGDTTLAGVTARDTAYPQNATGIVAIAAAGYALGVQRDVVWLRDPSASARLDGPAGQGRGNMILGNITVNGTCTIGSANCATATVMTGAQDINNFTTTGVYLLGDGCSANCPTPAHTLNSRGTALEVFNSPSQTDGTNIIQRLTAAGDSEPGDFYVRIFAGGSWGSWHMHQPEGAADPAPTHPIVLPSPEGGAATATGTLSPVPLTSSGQIDPVMPTTPPQSQQTCSKNSMWHDDNYIYVCVRSGLVKRVELQTFAGQQP